MILNCDGRPLKRAIGFLGGFVPESRGAALPVELYLVGLTIPGEKEEEEEDSGGLGDENRRIARPAG